MNNQNTNYNILYTQKGHRLIPKAQNGTDSSNLQGKYVVKAGDNLSKISKNLGISVKQLKELNNLTSDKIKIGQTLLISNNTPDKTIDKVIGNTENYGWDDPNKRGDYDKNKLKRTIDPGLGFDSGSYFDNGINYLFDIPTDNSTNLGNKYDRAFFHRHLGFPRDYNLMPLTNIRFTGDFNEDGTPKFPNAEYVGIDNYVKRFISEGVKRGYIDVDQDGFWTPKKETRSDHNWTKNTSHLGNYAIRENNGSGIYDVFDTYDFNEAISNRKKGYDIEVRDTIHGDNANPELYDPSFSSKKAENRKLIRKQKEQENSIFKRFINYLIN
jgi:LysM repeat protein